MKKDTKNGAPRRNHASGRGPKPRGANELRSAIGARFVRPRIRRRLARLVGTTKFASQRERNADRLRLTG